MSVSLAAGSGQPKTTGLSDIVSQGYEVELTDNRTHNWCSKFTGAQQIAIDTAVGPEQSTPSRERLPVRTSARGDSLPDNGDGRGAPYWITLPILGGETPETTYSNDLISPDLFSVSNVGKPRTQVRKYRWPTVTNSTFTEGRLKNVSVGGAVCWEDKGSIGFYGAAPSTLPGSFRGVVLALDPPPPIFDPARYDFDLSAGYRFNLLNDRARANVQLNGRNAFEDGRLRAVAGNPDGSIYAWRIVEPRRFILSAPFDH